MKIKQTQNHSTQFAGIHLPMGAVYAIVPAAPPMPKRYMWVTDLDAARNRRHFTMYVFSANDHKPRQVYVDGFYGFAAEFRRYIVNNGLTNSCIRRGSTRAQIAAGGDVPRDRKVGEYMMRGRPGSDSMPGRTFKHSNSARLEYEGHQYSTTQNYVTNGCRVGKNFYKEEAYCAMRLGMACPDYSKQG